MIYLNINNLPSKEKLDTQWKPVEDLFINTIKELIRVKTYNEIYEVIVNCIVKEFKKNKENIKPDTRLKEDLNLDSLDKVDLLVAIEAKYGEELIPSSDKKTSSKFMSTKTPDELATLIERIIDLKE